MKILVCDDERVIVDTVCDMITERYPDSFVIGIQRMKELVDSYSEEVFDIVFMDIVLESENGIDMGLYLSKKMPDAKIVFISGYQNRVSEIFFSLTPFGVIDKPIRPEMLYRYIEAAMSESENPKSYFTFNEKGKEKKVRYSDICYMESSREKVFVNTTSTQYHIYKKMSDVEKDFPDYFVKCHKSYLVNLRYVVEYKKQIFTMIDGKKINVARSKKEETELRYYKFKGGIS
ncbi:MAG: response regulator transcription factor [Clostridia bacterium]|nr:response regulator transcription factor [Clostridia bacterium]